MVSKLRALLGALVIVLCLSACTVPEEAESQSPTVPRNRREAEFFVFVSSRRKGPSAGQVVDGGRDLIERFAEDLFAQTAGVGIGRVEEIDALIERVIDDADRVAFIRLAAEGHRSEAEPGNLQPGSL